MQRLIGRSATLLPGLAASTAGSAFCTVLAVVFAVMGATPPVFAQPQPPVIGNIITNGDFTTDTEGWTAFTSSSDALAEHTLVDGSPTAGAARLGGTQEGTGETESSWTQCLWLADVPLPWTLGGRLRIAGGSISPPGFCGFQYSIRASLFSSANCTGSPIVAPLTQQGTAPGVIGPFTLYAGSIAVDPHLAAGGSQSASVELYFRAACSIDPGFVSGAVHFDRLYFGHIFIFADGFETGGTAAWSSATGV